MRCCQHLASKRGSHYPHSAWPGRTHRQSAGPSGAENQQKPEIASADVGKCWRGRLPGRRSRSMPMVDAQGSKHGSSPATVANQVAILALATSEAGGCRFFGRPRPDTDRYPSRALPRNGDRGASFPSRGAIVRPGAILWASCGIAGGIGGSTPPAASMPLPPHARPPTGILRENAIPEKPALCARC